MPGYPKKITAFPGLEPNIDAAFQWGRNSHLYFFKDSRYWKFDTTKVRMVTEGYPRQISEAWGGVPNRVEGAVQWDKKTFFFRGGQYWRLNDERISVEAGYPRLVRPSTWFTQGCDVQDNSGVQFFPRRDERPNDRLSPDAPVPAEDVSNNEP